MNYLDPAIVNLFYLFFLLIVVIFMTSLIMNIIANFFIKIFNPRKNEFFK